MTSTTTITTTIMIFSTSSNSKHAERLKSELEERKVCDRIDIHTGNPQKLLEALIIGKEFSDYRMLLIDDAVNGDPYELADNLKHNFPGAHLVLLSHRGKPAGTIDMIRSNIFFRAYRGDGWDPQIYRELREKPDVELTEDERKEKKEYEHACRLERLGFDVNYIKKPIKSYGVAAKKIAQIFVTGRYQHGLKVYSSPAEEKRAKSKEAFDAIMEENAIRTRKGVLIRTTPISLSTFLYRLELYGKDIIEKEQAAQIVKRLKEYEKEVQKEIENTHKVIRGIEDRFPSLVEDPGAFGVVAAKEQQQQQDEGTSKKQQ